MTFATSIRSEVQIIQTTATGERFVAKQYLGEDRRRRFIAETSVLRALSEHGNAPVPRLRALSASDLVIVMTEADGVPVENVIRSQERDTARLALAGYAGAIGLLHSVSREAVDGITSGRQEAGFREDDFLPPFARDPRESSRRVADLTGRSADALVIELRDVIAEGFAGDSLDTLIQWDTWPGNAIAAPDAVTLTDFEHALRGNALLDVSSWHLAFPAAPLRAPFAAQLPAVVMDEMDEAYQRTAGREITAERLAVAIAGRMLFELTASSAPRLLADLIATPIATLYELRLRRAASTLRAADVLPEFAAAMEQLASQLFRPDAEQLEPYAAFS